MTVQPRRIFEDVRIVNFAEVWTWTFVLFVTDLTVTFASTAIQKSDSENLIHSYLAQKLVISLKQLPNYISTKAASCLNDEASSILREARPPRLREKILGPYPSALQN